MRKKANCEERALHKAKLSIRKALKKVNADFANDTRLKPLAGRLNAQIFRWDRNHYSILVRIYDTKMEELGLSDKDFYFSSKPHPNILEPKFDWIPLYKSQFKSQFLNELYESYNKLFERLRTK